MWCTFANRANVLTVMVRTDPDVSKRHKGQAFGVPAVANKITLFRRICNIRSFY